MDPRQDRDFGRDRADRCAIPTIGSPTIEDGLALAKVHEFTTHHADILVVRPDFIGGGLLR